MYGGRAITSVDEEKNGLILRVRILIRLNAAAGGNRANALCPKVSPCFLA